METLLPALVGVMLLAQVAAQQLQPVGERTGLVPLTEMGGQQYKGQDGGLYGQGRNDPPTAHLNAALSEANRIVPLDADGKAGTDGRIVLLSLGMSNTTMEFSTFVKLVLHLDGWSPSMAPKTDKMQLRGIRQTRSRGLRLNADCERQA